jgi:multidrug efflux system membrane fusion protein
VPREEESPLSFRVGGQIVRRLVDAGDRVQRGDLLAELDPGDLRAAGAMPRKRKPPPPKPNSRALRGAQALTTHSRRNNSSAAPTLDAQNAPTPPPPARRVRRARNRDVARNQTPTRNCARRATA